MKNGEEKASYGKCHRCLVFFDGSNVYNRLKELGIVSTSLYDFHGLAEYLVGDGKLVSCNYFVGVVRARQDDARGQELRHKQQKLFNHLLSQNFIIERGYLLETNGRYHEKGVDVKMAVDLLVGAYENAYDSVLLLSSDTDIIPAIKKVEQLGKSVVYVGFEHRPSIALQREASAYRILRKGEVQRFVYKKSLE